MDGSTLRSITLTFNFEEDLATEEDYVKAGF